MRALIAVFLFPVHFWMAPAALAEDDAVIQVRPVVEIEGEHPQIVLGDLMVARGIPAATLDALKDVRLADTPKDGESRTFTSLALEQVFREQLRLAGSAEDAKVSLRFPPRVTVVRKSFRLEARQVEAALRAQLKTFCADCVFEISRLTLPALPPSVPSDSTWAIRLRQSLPKGGFSLPLEVLYADASKRTYWLTGSLSVSKRVPVASRALSAGERLAPQDFNMQTREVTFATDVPPAESEIAVSVMSRSVAAGEILWRSTLRREQIVKYGDLVKVVTGAEGWQISIDGVAQGAGAIGDAVKVKINRTQKLVSGVLTERGTVEVH